MPLSEDEQRILQQIEQQLYASDPQFADELDKHTLAAHHLRRMRLAAVAFLAGIVVLVGALATESSFVIAFIGFVAMLVSALAFEHDLRRLGKAGLSQLGGKARPGVVRDYFGSTRRRVKDRFRRDED